MNGLKSIKFPLASLKISLRLVVKQRTRFSIVYCCCLFFWSLSGLFLKFSLRRLLEAGLNNLTVDKSTRLRSKSMHIFNNQNSIFRSKRTQVFGGLFPR